MNNTGSTTPPTPSSSAAPADEHIRKRRNSISFWFGLDSTKPLTLEQLQTKLCDLSSIELHGDQLKDLIKNKQIQVSQKAFDACNGHKAVLFRDRRNMKKISLVTKPEHIENSLFSLIDCYANLGAQSIQVAVNSSKEKKLNFATCINAVAAKLGVVLKSEKVRDIDMVFSVKLEPRNQLSLDQYLTLKTMLFDFKTSPTLTQRIEKLFEPIDGEGISSSTSEEPSETITISMKYFESGDFGMNFGVGDYDGETGASYSKRTEDTLQFIVTWYPRNKFKNSFPISSIGKYRYGIWFADISLLLENMSDTLTYNTALELKMRGELDERIKQLLNQRQAYEESSGFVTKYIPNVISSAFGYGKEQNEITASLDSTRKQQQDLHNDILKVQADPPIRILFIGPQSAGKSSICVSLQCLLEANENRLIDDYPRTKDAVLKFSENGGFIRVRALPPYADGNATLKLNKATEIDLFEKMPLSATPILHDIAGGKVDPDIFKGYYASIMVVEFTKLLPNGTSEDSIETVLEESFQQLLGNFPEGEMPDLLLLTKCDLLLDDGNTTGDVEANIKNRMLKIVEKENWESQVVRKCKVIKEKLKLDIEVIPCVLLVRSKNENDRFPLQTNENYFKKYIEQSKLVMCEILSILQAKLTSHKWDLRNAKHENSMGFSSFASISTSSSVSTP